jgi:hypothetical protein
MFGVWVGSIEPILVAFIAVRESGCRRPRTDHYAARYPCAAGRRDNGFSTLELRSSLSVKRYSISIDSYTTALILGEGINYRRVEVFSQINYQRAIACRIGGYHKRNSLTPYP